MQLQFCFGRTGSLLGRGQ